MTESPRNTEEVVERLVKLADPGPAIPTGGAAQLKSAIRPLWRREVRARAIRRYTTWGAVLGAAASIAAFIILPRFFESPPEFAGRIEIARGTVQIEPDGNRDEIASGSRITTDGSSRAAIRLASRSSVRLDVDTELRLVSSRVIELERGAVYVDSVDAREPIEIRTEFGIARDIGTQFEVRSDGALTIRVRDGAVAFATRGADVRIDSGTEIVVTRDGSHRTNPIAADAGSWNWIHAVAPPFLIEGRSVSSFLSWVSRETGAPIRYEDREAERIAATTTLHGSLGELRPDEAPEVILPSAGLEALREPSGALVVKQLSPMERR